jgi:hypothetical protein
MRLLPRLYVVEPVRRRECQIAKANFHPTYQSGQA